MIDLAVKLFPAAAAALCLMGLLAVAFQVRKLAREDKGKEPDPLASEIAGLKWEIISLADRISVLESAEPRETTGATQIRSGMNLNKRTQALRQHRQGQPSIDIAKTLDMPKAEVDLLVKVHRIVSQG